MDKDNSKKSTSQIRELRDVDPYFSEKDQSSDTDTSGTGGKSDAVEFRFKDAMSTAPRDDQLSPKELEVLLLHHKDHNKKSVEKQREALKEIAALKEGKKVHTESRRYGLGQGGGGGASEYKTHPVSQHAQFSGTDKQVSNLPTQLDANTNEGDKQKLDNQYRLTHAPKNAPTFNPRPQFP